MAPVRFARLIAPGFTLAHPGLGCLFTCESKALLRDLLAFTNKAYLSRVTDAVVGAFTCSDCGVVRERQLSADSVEQVGPSRPRMY